MSQRVRADSIAVCVVADNQLAAQYLLQLLAKDRRIRACTLIDLETQAHHANTLFVLDNCGLELPLNECLRRLRTRYSDARFIVLDKHQPEEEILRLLWYGIQGFLPHREVKSQLRPAIHSVSEGKMWVAVDLLHTYMIHRHETRNPSKDASLTQREEQIMELVKRRFSNKEIGTMLRIRESTVKFHLSNVFSKTQAESRRDLVNGSETLHKWAAFLTPKYRSS